MALTLQIPPAFTVRPLDGGTVLPVELIVQIPLASAVRLLDGGTVFPMIDAIRPIVSIPDESAVFTHYRVYDSMTS
jgi:hypothetical protein